MMWLAIMDRGPLHPDDTGDFRASVCSSEAAALATLTHYLVEAESSAQTAPPMKHGEYLTQQLGDPLKTESGFVWGMPYGGGVSLELRKLSMTERCFCHPDREATKEYRSGMCWECQAVRCDLGRQCQ